jgi:hypothetical protein
VVSAGGVDGEAGVVVLLQQSPMSEIKSKGILGIFSAFCFLCSVFCFLFSVLILIKIWIKHKVSCIYPPPKKKKKKKRGPGLTNGLSALQTSSASAKSKEQRQRAKRASGK